MVSAPDNDDAKVDCGTCTACCKRELVSLVDGDNLADFPEAVAFPPDGIALMKGILPSFLGFVIPHKPDGGCVYLGDNGCTIYDKRPKMCRGFSCVDWVNKILAETTRNERRRDKAMIDTDVWKAGMKRRAK